VKPRLIALLALLCLALTAWPALAEEAAVPGVGSACPAPGAAAVAPRARIAVMPVELPREVGPAPAHCPICGVALATGEIKPGGEERVAELIYNWLLVNRCYDVISPGVSEGAYQSALRDTMTASPVAYMRAVGNQLGAEAVLGGILYRYRERAGKAYSVSKAASIGFDLHLVRTSDGMVLWSARFDETQKTLTENMFDIFKFFKLGVRWLTVDDYAVQAVSETLKDFPTALNARK